MDDAVVAALVGAVVGGGIAPLVAFGVMRGEQRHRVNARILLELLPHTLAEVRAARDVAEFGTDDAQRLRESTGRLVAALALGSRSDRKDARWLSEHLTDFEPAQANEGEATAEDIEDLARIAAASIEYPRQELTQAEELLIRVHDRLVSRLLGSDDAPGI